MALADAMDPRYRAAVLLAAYGGLRAGELFGLRTKRVDPLRRTITIAETVVDVGGHPYFGPPKTRTGRRTVPLPRVAADPLAEHLRTYDRQPDDLVFTAPEGGPVQLNVWRQRFWAPAVRDAGLAHLRPHDYPDLRVIPTSGRRRCSAVCVVSSGRHNQRLSKNAMRASGGR
jgi:integrase